MRPLLLASLLTVSTLFTGAQALAEERGEIRPDTEVVIHEQKDKTIYEYSNNGFVYAYKVVPKGGGTPYYLIAADNEGNFFRSDDVGALTPNRMAIPSWKIIEW
ncbi:DUF2782 domain-containing protein [Aestuariirhabdus litorea]|uniref:DUF2782 domain-containing protein n=1 Tax=Aestuariirhabdus litorea TaxID=2528527 RepID=A0A3P3VLG0_9GAMM|nr:DUF2782 domain-containing protein [Aestuariirhabdus litorea]RRJ82556.1 DUF2782 domain-containing protein [Aestuariirhabdus litorea]RWW92716.1 DUF2782 domain-containing protein [Endozoicomonadaceae bacterium GTF-13]